MHKLLFYAFCCMTVGLAGTIVAVAMPGNQLSVSAFAGAMFGHGFAVAMLRWFKFDKFDA